MTPSLATFQKKDYLTELATYSSMRQNSNQFAVPDVILSTMTGIMGFKEVAPSTVGEGILENLQVTFCTEGRNRNAGII